MTKKTSSKYEKTNLFFYHDSLKLHETWDFDFKFQVFPDRQGRRTNSSVHFWKKFFVNFAFEIYWPLVIKYVECRISYNCWMLQKDRFYFCFVSKCLHISDSRTNPSAQGLIDHINHYSNQPFSKHFPHPQMTLQNDVFKSVLQ